MTSEGDTLLLLRLTLVSPCPCFASTLGAGLADLACPGGEREEHRFHGAWGGGCRGWYPSESGWGRFLVCGAGGAWGLDSREASHPAGCGPGTRDAY